MNLIDVTGGTKKQRQLAYEVAEFCIEKLMPRHRTLDIIIKLNRCGDTGAMGYCCVGDHNREFIIEIDNRIYKNDIREFITSLCHEMVHVWQWVTGILEDRVYPKSLGYRTLWKGKDYTKTPYSRQPWERQAYRMQEKLFKKYLTSPLTKVF